ncbi:hypothetical protein CASFOL_020217 [Castilleja foliolosa]|uniref:NAB domain-containing protein n=1 Tax=Castilleja foliolosa TaxID=1961234 RepID=A0ABD3D081_9LAMI
MTKHPWKSMSNHIDPEKEEQLKWVKIETENQVKRVIKNITDNERNSWNKSEVISIVEDFQNQYESLYFLYEDLKEQVKKNVNCGDASTSNSDSESFYSPGGSYTPRSSKKSNSSSNSNDSSENDQISVLEDTVLKDKLTCSSEVKQITNLDSRSESGESLTDVKVQGDSESENVMEQKKDLEELVESLRLEISRLCMEKGELKEQLECKSDIALKMKETISRLEAQVLGIDAESKENERRFYSVKQFELDTEQKYIPQDSELVAQANDTQIELGALRNQKKGLIEEVNALKNELASVNSQKNDLQSEIEMKSNEMAKCMIQIENMKNELSSNEQRLSEENEDVRARVNGLESKIRSLLVAKTELEEQVKKLNHEASQSNRKITELENEKIRLQKELEKSQYGSLLSKSQVEKFSKSNFQAVEKKVEDMLVEFRKKLEDQYRILSRRIRVAEQLQVENKEWYRKTKEAYEQQNKDLKLRAERNEIELKNVKDMTLSANDFLTSLDSVAMSFEENSGNFLNRISKASCELKFAKHWVMRKKKVNVHVKDEMDCLLAQMNDKEAEILVFREKVWRSDNKVRELEKMVKEKEDAMMGLKEEKREAIRQLCVWIDYHRGRSDHYMKMLSEMSPIRKRTA